MPTVSVVLPTYNRAYTIRRAIDSILAQTYTDFELIVVDDGSTDDTQSVVQTYTDSRMRYTPIKHSGGAAARNAGIKNANGTYIAFQDSDDEWLPTKLEKQISLFQKASPHIGVVYTGFFKTSRDGKKIYFPPDSVQHKEGNVFSEMLVGNFVTNQAAMVRKTCFDDIGGYDESLPGMHELDLWLRMSKKYEFAYIPEALVVTYFTDDSITAHSEWRLRGREIIFNKHYDEFKKYPSIFALHAFTIGNARALRGDFQDARRYLLLAWKTQLLNIKYFFAFLLALVGSKKIYRLLGKHANRIV